VVENAGFAHPWDNLGESEEVAGALAGHSQEPKRRRTVGDGAGMTCSSDAFSDGEPIVQAFVGGIMGRRERETFRVQGGIPLAVELLAGGDARAKENAADAVMGLCRQDRRDRVAIREAGGIPPLTALLAEGSPDAKAKAAGALMSLAKADDENRRLISDTQTIQHLVALLSGTPAQQENATGAIAELAMRGESRALFREAGALGPLEAFADNATPEAGNRRRLADLALRHLRLG